MGVREGRWVRTFENVNGRFWAVLPYITVFPRTPGFREDFNAVHVGWWVWQFKFKYVHPRKQS